MRIRSFALSCVLIFALFVGAFATQAQTVLTYGQGVVGSVSAQAPIAFYSFQGQANDSVTIQVLGLTSGLKPAISLNSPTGQQLGTSNLDPTNVLADSARLTERLPQAGLYTIIVLSPTGVLGDYAIRLDGVATTQESQPDTSGNSSGQVNTGASLFVYSMPALNVPQIATVSTDAAGVNFTVAVTAPTGQQIGLLSGNSQQPAITTLPAGTGTYTLEVTISAQTQATINLNVAPLGEAPPVTNDPVIPPTATVPPAAPTEAEQAPPPTQQQQPPPPTATVEQQQQPTATFTPSYTPTTPATATFTPSYTPTTPPAAQEAPADARFNNPLNIQLDSTVSVLDFVSYPGGDTEDRVAWDIIGMNNNSSLSGGRARLVISVSCFGTNTDQVQFFTGGQTYACGQTIVDREVTAGNKTGSVVITAVGGEGTYVQWVLTGTATRTN